MGEHFCRSQTTVLGKHALAKTEKASFGLMGGFVYEQGIFDSNEMATALSGPCGGFSFDLPFGDSGSNLGLNYAYRQSVLGGIHTVGGRINIGN